MAKLTKEQIDERIKEMSVDELKGLVKQHKNLDEHKEAEKLQKEIERRNK